MLICVLYYLINNYVCIDYICCQWKKLSIISYDRIFKQKSYNILLGVGITEVLMNLVSYHGFIEKPNSTVILNCQYRLLNKYLAKGFLLLQTAPRS